MLKVLIVDDHTLFRKSMTMLVSSFSNVGMVKDAANGKDCLNTLEQEPFDIILLDYDMPILNGRKTSKRIIKDFPNSKIIMVSMYDSLDLISELISIGVHSYLLKKAEPSEVQKAINYVSSNEFYYNKLVFTALQKSVEIKDSISEVKKQTGLSNREIEILKLICKEFTAREIADMISVSELTVQTHRKNLMKKVGSKNVIGLVKYAFQQKIASF
ncbi:MAG: response regulator transcription factor [Bacteroidota bacterium]